HLRLDEDILKALGELSINYVFQPIFFPDGKTVYAWEALMRPTQKTVLELINEYMEAGNLHVLEVATLFGAMQAYVLRGYTERVSINSFPNDCLRQDEADVFLEYYGNSIRGRMIIENLEYPYFSYETWLMKKASIKAMDNLLSADDFGSGINDMERIDIMEPDIVKLDRELISGIDHDPEKQNNVARLVSVFHSKNILVVAEGVEEKEEFDYLLGLGVDFFQGFYLARPA
ncbi:MAG: EAL domain-containing protein, partial [Lachnospiraceae bacterium]|nr:EAL domain-containing protein [Lachnospiraceae bacterium]